MAKGAPSLTPTARKPGGSLVTRSPWLIQTCCAVALAPDAVEQRAVLGDLDEGAAELAMVRALDLAAELGAQGLLAIADAEQRHAHLEGDLRRARGVPISVTEAGPPERMMALGANSAMRCGSVLKGMISQ